MLRPTLVVLVASLAGCASEAPRAEPPLRPVRFVEVQSTGGVRTRSFAGVAQAAVESTLSFRVRGNVQRIHVRTGDRVEAGQLIAELDPTDFRLQVQEAEAALLQAQAQSRQADAEYERVRGLYENRNASRSDLDAARARAESSRAQIEAAQQRVEQARAQLSYTRLVAPLSGAIAAVPVEVSENVDSGRAIAVLTSGEQPQVDVPVPEVLIGEVQQGNGVEIAFDALPGRSFPGVVAEVGVMSTSLATAFPVTVQLARPEPDVRSGMAARVSFTFGTGDERDRFLVPSHAVSEDRRGRFVYVVTPTSSSEGVVRRRDVVIGELTGDGLEIFEGLEEGDRVVTAGVSQIEDGLEVALEPGS